MSTLVYLIPIALSLGGLGLAAFLWSIKSGQYEDLDGAAWRVLDDGDASTGHGERPDDGRA
ncbi:cbb3-type cytochrome oxidase assembly protein CcoS [Mycoplana ramosa]|uniref:Cbb3-type cytochrome oxidase assembly protein CcoS n=1 Tax=Mycoplana ramosa TaxID=40837 RepID=A0ABW3YSA3_MYCRA